MATLADGVVGALYPAVTVPTERSWVRKIRFLVQWVGELGGWWRIVRGGLAMYLSYLSLGIFVDWSTSGFLENERWQVCGVVRISSEVLVDDIGLSVPVVEGAFGLLSNESAGSREVFHNSRWCPSQGRWLSAIPVKFGESIPVGAGGLGVPLLEF